MTLSQTLLSVSLSTASVYSAVSVLSRLTAPQTLPCHPQKSGPTRLNVFFFFIQHSAVKVHRHVCAFEFSQTCITFGGVFSGVRTFTTYASHSKTSPVRPLPSPARLLRQEAPHSCRSIADATALQHAGRGTSAESATRAASACSLTASRPMPARSDATDEAA